MDEFYLRVSEKGKFLLYPNSDKFKPGAYEVVGGSRIETVKDVGEDMEVITDDGLFIWSHSDKEMTLRQKDSYNGEVYYRKKDQDVWGSQYVVEAVDVF